MTLEAPTTLNASLVLHGTQRFHGLGRRLSLRPVKQPAQTVERYCQLLLNKREYELCKKISEDGAKKVAAGAPNCDRFVLPRLNKPAAKACQPVQAEPAGGAVANRTQLEADAGFICVGSTSKIVELLRVDRTTTTVRLEVMVQAEQRPQLMSQKQCARSCNVMVGHCQRLAVHVRTTVGGARAGTNFAGSVNFFAAGSDTAIVQAFLFERFSNRVVTNGFIASFTLGTNESLVTIIPLEHKEITAMIPV